MIACLHSTVAAPVGHCHHLSLGITSLHKSVYGCLLGIAGLDVLLQLPDRSARTEQQASPSYGSVPHLTSNNS